MKHNIVLSLLLVIGCFGIVGCGKKEETTISTEKVTEIVSEEVVEEEVPFETVNVLDYSKIGDLTYLIIGDSFGDCEKYEVDIEQTYLEAMIDAKPYIDIKVKFGEKVENNKNVDLYNTEDVGTVLDNKEELQVGTITDWEFYDGKDLGKMDLTSVCEYIKDKYSLPKNDEEETDYKLVVKDVVKEVSDNSDIEYLKIVDKNNFVFYDYRNNVAVDDYEIGETKEVHLINGTDQLTESNPLTQTYLIVDKNGEEE